MKKLLFILGLLLPAVSFADYNGSLYDPKYGNLLYLRVYQPIGQICVQVNSMNHICWTTGVVTNNLLLETGAFLLLENGTDLTLE